MNKSRILLFIAAIFISSTIMSCSVQRSGQSRKCAKVSKKSRSIKSMAPGMAR